MSKKTKDEILSKETETSVENKKSAKEETSEKIMEVRKQEQSLLDSWKQSKYWKESIESESYFEMINYIRMVAMGLSNGAIISGEGGLGKSFTTISILNQENPNYAYTDSYSTPIAFYAWIYKNKTNILVLDDVVGILEDKRGNAYLKSALWEVNGKRIINNMSMKPPIDEFGMPIPDHFEFTGGIIILTNSLNTKKPHIKSILTRVNHNHIIIGFEEKIKIIEKISKKPYGNLSETSRKEIFEFIKQKSSESTEELNLRTLVKVYNFYEYSRKIGSKDLWKRLAMGLLKKDDKLLLMEELEKQEIPVVDKVKKFNELTGMGRSEERRVGKEC